MTSLITTERNPMEALVIILIFFGIAYLVIGLCIGIAGAIETELAPWYSRLALIVLIMVCWGPCMLFENDLIWGFQDWIEASNFEKKMNEFNTSQKQQQQGKSLDKE